MKYRPVLIHWVDATSFDAWEPAVDAMKSRLHTIKTLGFLMKETEDTIQVALNWDEEGEQVSQYILIPKAWVKSQRFVRLNLKGETRAKKKQKSTPAGGDSSRS